jgi:hypothetical protein
MEAVSCRLAAASWLIYVGSQRSPAPSFSLHLALNCWFLPNDSTLHTSFRSRPLLQRRILSQLCGDLLQSNQCKVGIYEPELVHPGRLASSRLGSEILQITERIPSRCSDLEPAIWEATMGSTQPNIPKVSSCLRDICVNCAVFMRDGKN